MAKSTRFSPSSQIRRVFMFAAIVGMSASALAQVPLVNPSFEIPALPNGQLLAATAGLGWEIRGDVALYNLPSALWNANIARQHGRQWAFLRAGTAISQTVSLQPGTYVVSLQAAQAGAATAAQIKATVGTISAAPLTPAMASGVMTFGGITIATAGSYKLTLEVPEPAPGAGFSYGVSLDDVIVGQAGTNVAPSVVIVTPMSGQSIIATTTLLRADARDSDGTISRVEFYDGATLLGTAVATPWTFSMNSNSNLARNITAKAYDNLGASTISDPVYFSHNTGGLFPFVRNGNFESPGLAASSYSDSPDSWISYNGGIATAGAIPPFGHSAPPS